MTTTLVERAESVAETKRRARFPGDNGNGKRGHVREHAPKHMQESAREAERESEAREPGAIGWLRAGCSPAKAAERLAAETGMDAAAARESVVAAVSELAGCVWTGGREGRLALAVEQRERVLREAMVGGDWKLALAVLESRERLMGLFGEAPSGGAETLLDLLRGAGGGGCE